ncbi:MAG: hypothetical protein ABJ360_03130 [Roseobacter sp.]|uniref:hypothetical protein n=1 Tax=Tateyamaria sp. TaxID=1929288 RepID=UPI00326E8052
MNNIIAFQRKAKPHARIAVKKMTDNVISFVDWRAGPRPIRTPNGVFFTTESLRFSGNAA